MITFSAPSFDDLFIPYSCMQECNTVTPHLRLHHQFPGCLVTRYTDLPPLQITNTSLGRKRGLEGAFCPLWPPGTPSVSKARIFLQCNLHPLYVKPKRERLRRRSLTITSFRAQKQHHSCIRFRNGSPHPPNLLASTPPGIRIHRIQASEPDQHLLRASNPPNDQSNPCDLGEPDHHQLKYKIYWLRHWPHSDQTNRHPLNYRVLSPQCFVQIWVVMRGSQKYGKRTLWTGG